METEELIKLVDGIYKNILEKFNPGARQMINAGKTYLKALHGAAAASRLYVDAITKLARQAQQGTWGGSSDIGSALMKIVEVYKEIQEQQMNILKAFYVDLLVPLETNLEKDTKVVQSEQKKFLQQHKQRSETYSKAAAMMKKQRKKSRGSTKTGLAMDKELKNMQVLEEEKTKLDAFCEQSLKTAMTQERRRYGFVLERQCSLAKHYLSYHSQGVTAYQQNIDEWSEVAKTREFLPEAVENMFTSRMRQVSFWPDEDVYSNPRSPHLDDDRLSITSQLRKTKSMDASCLDIRSIGDASSPMLSMSRAKSDFNLTASTHSLVQDCNSPPRRPKSMALPSQPPAWDIQLARALYAYLSSGENQLSFLEGDVIALMGDRNKGWQFGENLRTQCSGWFPLAYTEILDDPTISPSHRIDASGSNSGLGVSTPIAGSLMSPAGPPASGSHPGSGVDHPTPRMFGDTLHLHRSSANAKQIRRVTGATNYIPPPALPAPVPTPMLPFGKLALTQSQSTTFATPGYPTTSFPVSQYAQTGIKQSASSFNFTSTPASGYSTHPQGIRSERPPPMPPLPLHLQTKVGGKIGVAVGNVSLHSSNDSGFSNDPPPQPEVDYSDDDTSMTLSKVPIRKSQRKPTNDDNNNTRTLPLRPSNSHGNLVEPRPSYNNDTLISTTTEKKGLIKRTKSFWRFGKHNSDHEILEGMSMWKHRDLIDVNEQLIQAVVTTKTESPENVMNNRTSGSERSNDSDKTINAKQIEESNEEMYGVTEPAKRSASFKTNQKLSLPVRKDSETGHDIQFENDFEINNKDQFYDDEGDGLMLRTVNRKDILKQYNTDTITDTDSESEATSDDPYDCIVVDDQTKQKMKRSNGDKYLNSGSRKRSNSEQFPNVAEIGKKLEQFSKSNKYSPDSKELSKEQIRNSMNNKMNARNNEIDSDHQEILTYRNSRSHQNLRSPTPEPRHSFKTFGIEENEHLEMQKLENQKTPQPEIRRKPRHYSENDSEMSPVARPKDHLNDRRSKEMPSLERRSKEVSLERRPNDASPERRFTSERRSKEDTSERRPDLSERRSHNPEIGRANLSSERRPKDSERRPELSERRPKDMSSERRSEMTSERRADISERRSDLSERKSDLSSSAERRSKHPDMSSERRNADMPPRSMHPDVSLRSTKMSPVERRRKQNGDASSERRAKHNGSGKSNGDVQRRARGHSESEQQYYQETSGEESKYDHEVANRPFLPRTKLVKSNSIGATMQTVMKFEQEIVEYGDGNIKHKKKAEYGASYEDVVPNHGNIYGPWYDLWGLDATVQK